MNPKLDAGLAERLYSKWYYTFHTDYFGKRAFCDCPESVTKPWQAVAAAVRKIVKEAKEGK